MLVYLDSKDLINVLERSEPVSTEGLAEKLLEAKARLLISFVTVAELSAPLHKHGAKTNVMQLLQRLETLPHVFLADCRVEWLELKEAVDAFDSGRDYSRVDPFVSRFDHTIPVRGRPPTAHYLAYSIAETVWDLWTSDPCAFDGYASHIPRYDSLLTRDRALKRPPPLSDHFAVVLKRNLELLEIDSRSLDVRDLGRWIYASPRRCPATRLGFEVWHRLRSNVTDVPKRSDLGDFNHLYSIPYADVVTLDSRMLGYVRQAVHEANDNGLAVCFPSVREVLEVLTSAEM